MIKELLGWLHKTTTAPLCFANHQRFLVPGTIHSAGRVALYGVFDGHGPAGHRCAALARGATSVIWSPMTFISMGARLFAGTDLWGSRSPHLSTRGTRGSFVHVVIGSSSQLDLCRCSKQPSLKRRQRCWGTDHIGKSMVLLREACFWIESVRTQQAPWWMLYGYMYKIVHICV